MRRHVGKLSNTDLRCVIVFMQIPNREDHALVVTTDNLPPRFEQALLDVVDSPEGQAETVLANVLSRRMMPDSTKTLLQAMHEAGVLRAVPVTQVIMLPEPNRPYPLADILAMNAAAALGGEAAARAEEETRFNPHANNQNAANSEQRLGIARNLIIEAEMLEADAKSKREKAYQYAPELRPRTKKVAVEKVVELAQTSKSRKASGKGKKSGAEA